MALTERLPLEAREEMRRHFSDLPAERFFAACLVFFSRELRFAPMHRDYQGMADVLTIAKTRGLVSQLSHAVERVELQIWQGIPPPPEAKEIPAWERPKRSNSKVSKQFDGDMWEHGSLANSKGGGLKYGEDTEPFPESQQPSADSREKQREARRRAKKKRRV